MWTSFYLRTVLLRKHKSKVAWHGKFVFFFFIGTRGRGTRSQMYRNHKVEPNSEIRKCSCCRCKPSLRLCSGIVAHCHLQHQTMEKNENTKASTEQEKYLEGGWGWWVVLGSALSHFFIVGTPRSFGIFYEELRVRYERSASETAWIIALSNTLRMLFGRFEHRCCLSSCSVRRAIAPHIRA